MYRNKREVAQAIIPDGDKVLYKLNNDEGRLFRNYEKEFWVCCFAKEPLKKPYRNIKPQKVFIVLKNQGATNYNQPHTIFNKDRDDLFIKIDIYKSHKLNGSKLKSTIEYSTNPRNFRYGDSIMNLMVFDNEKECRDYYTFKIEDCVKDAELEKQKIIEKYDNEKNELYEILKNIS